MVKVCVDPGHGMSNRTKNLFDPGATHKEDGIVFQEAVIALQYGLTLREALRARSADVFMTRDDDQDHAPVVERAVNARKAGCDSFVSLHLNDVESDAANGLEVLYGKESDKALAKSIGDALSTVTGIKRRQDKLRTDLAVLKFAGRAILIELGFIANDGDRQILLNPQIRGAVCEQIALKLLP